MNILFCSQIIDYSVIDLDKVKNVLSNADSNFNIKIWSGLKDNKNVKLKVYNTLPIGSYPKYKKIILRAKSGVFKANGESLGFINIIVLKYISLFFNYFFTLKKEIKYSNEKIYIICYDFFIPILLSIYFVKKIFKNKVTVCLIVPDIPIYQPKENGFKNYLFEKLNKLKMFLGKSFDSFVLLTKYMVEPLQITQKPYTIIEGICENEKSDKNEIPLENENIISILYSGKLDKIYNIDKLLEACINIKEKKLQLWLCGHGDMVESIKKVCLKNPKIKYFGYLNNDETKVLQKKANILINPRSTEGEYTKYSFPSKTIEYLLQGKPMLGFKLKGIPKEYDEYIIYIKENTTKEIEKSIKYVILNYEEIKVKSLKSRKFILENKNPNIQCQKIYEMLKNMERK